MKKFILLSIITGLMLSIVGCGDNSNSAIESSVDNSEIVLSADEQYVFDIIKKTYLHLKDPDSMKLRSNILIIENNEDKMAEIGKYCFFVYSATNSMGGSTKSLMAYKDNICVGNLDDGLEREYFDTDEEYLDYLSAGCLYSMYSLRDDEEIKSSINFDAKLVDCKVIAEKLNIDYIEGFDIGEYYDVEKGDGYMADVNQETTYEYKCSSSYCNKEGIYEFPSSSNEYYCYEHYMAIKETFDAFR